MKKVNYLWVIIILILALFLFKPKSFTGAVVPAGICIKSDIVDTSFFNNWRSATWISLDSNTDGVMEGYGYYSISGSSSNCDDKGSLLSSITTSSEYNFENDIKILMYLNDIRVCRSKTMSGGSTYITFKSSVQHNFDLTACGNIPTPSPSPGVSPSPTPNVTPTPNPSPSPGTSPTPTPSASPSPPSGGFGCSRG
jgi:hypothetical protein